MKTAYLLLITLAAVAGMRAEAQEMSALSCDDFRPTQEALERFPELVGACEGVAERDGELYGLFRAIVRRASISSVTLNLPATDNTFTVRPGASARVLIDGQKVPIRDLVRGQEIHIYLAVNEFAKPDIQNVALVSEADVLIELEITEVAALPTTASIWSAVASIGLVLLASGLLLRRRRLDSVSAAVVCVLMSVAAMPVEAQTQTRTVEIPARVATSMVRSVVIVEAVDKESRELKVIDASGRRYTLAVDQSVLNFNQIEPRDRIVTAYYESVAVYVVPEGAPTMGDATAVELAPIGGKPGIEIADTVMISATIEALNISDRIATIRGEDGSVRSLKLADEVPLENIDVGDEVRLRITQAIAISVQEVGPA